jgi:tetratricopeptide (TPR) repeat protein
MTRTLSFAALAVSLAALAFSFAALRKDAARLEDVEKRLAAAEKLKEPYWQAAVYYNLGEAYEKSGQPEMAKTYYGKVTGQFEGNAQAGDLPKQAAEKLKALGGR